MEFEDGALGTKARGEAASLGSGYKVFSRPGTSQNDPASRLAGERGEARLLFFGLLFLYTSLLEANRHTAASLKDRGITNRLA